MMSTPGRLTLRTRIDDYSYQVSAEEDGRFWFRLEREDDRDIITDFFIGSAPEETAADLLADCYRTLGLTPAMVVVFRDILPAGRTRARRSHSTRHWPFIPRAAKCCWPALGLQGSRNDSKGRGPSTTSSWRRTGRHPRSKPTVQALPRSLFGTELRQWGEGGPGFAHHP